MMVLTPIREQLTRPGMAVILGYGGSGRAAHTVLAARGFACRVADATRPEHLPAPIARWSLDDDLSALDGASLVVKSPGVDRRHPLVTAALAAGVPVVGEVELGWAIAQAAIVGITGSNGKSTTTALLAHILQRAGRQATAAGNIGEPLTAAAAAMPETGTLVVELSSFQLEDLSEFECDGAILLNITPDHIDRHGTLDVYRELKLSILDRVRPGGFRILNADDPALADACRMWRTREPATTILVSLHGQGDATVDGTSLMLADPGSAASTPVSIGRTTEMTIAGPHNQFNALAAGSAAIRLGVSPTAVADGIHSFAPLRHRLESVATIDGVEFVNDSKATNLDSLRQALRAFPEGGTVLIAGGRDKDTPFHELATEIASRVRHVVLIGEAATTIEAAWPAVSSSCHAQFEDAVRTAFERARPRGVVLLSPGCASFDMFSGFADRGEQFIAIVKRIAADAAPRGES